ncbi:MAG: hypothetical protein EHM37_21815 [Deltaproteobacteria bacterium]|nr:MAG: hypothetical protein EHM37_21815 [Deltaproteobacteria bacterium]
MKGFYSSPPKNENIFIKHRGNEQRRIGSGKMPVETASRVDPQKSGQAFKPFSADSQIPWVIRKPARIARRVFCVQKVVTNKNDSQLPKSRILAGNIKETIYSFLRQRHSAMFLQTC